jgi:hypothetical protein
LRSPFPFHPENGVVMRPARVVAVVALLLVPAVTEVTLDFEGINAVYPTAVGEYAQVLNFYNGGTSSDGTTSSTSAGVAFSSNGLAICLNTPLNPACSGSSRGGLAPGSALGALYFLDGTQTFMNVATGFQDGLSFVYSALRSGSVSVFDGLDGAGNLLATLNLGPTPVADCDMGTYRAAHCPFVPADVAFAGVARSVAFQGAPNDIVFDDVHLDVEVRDGPEPSTVSLLGLAVAAAHAWRRRRRAKA